MNQQGDPTGRLHFTGGKAPRGIKGLLRGVPVPIEIFVGAEHSEVQIQQAVETAHHAARAATPTGVSVATEFDHDASVVVVSVADGGGSPVRERSNVEGAAQAAVAEKLPDIGSIPVRLEAVPEDGIGDDVIRGGALLGGSSSSSFACTSGWAVNSTSDSTKGLVTADHCPDSMSYSGRHVLRYRRSVAKNVGDVQYLSSTEKVGRAFYYGVGTYRKVRSRGSPSQDLYLCKFGRKTGKTCDRVRDTFTCRNSYCHLVSMDHRKAAKGDSGGPWFYGSRAYGVHSGAHTSWFKKRDQWSALSRTLANLETKLRVAK